MPLFAWSEVECTSADVGGPFLGHRGLRLGASAVQPGVADVPEGHGLAGVAAWLVDRVSQASAINTNFMGVSRCGVGGIRGGGGDVPPLPGRV